MQSLLQLKLLIELISYTNTLRFVFTCNIKPVCKASLLYFRIYDAKSAKRSGLFTTRPLRVVFTGIKLQEVSSLFNVELFCMSL